MDHLTNVKIVFGYGVLNIDQVSIFSPSQITRFRFPLAFLANQKKICIISVKMTLMSGILKIDQF